MSSLPLMDVPPLHTQAQLCAQDAGPTGCIDLTLRRSCTAVYGVIQFFRGLGQYLQNQGAPAAATSSAGGKGKGHVLAFIKGDCIVMLMQAGAEAQVSAEKLQVCAHAIESRIQ